jgi:chemotaxis protein methyltransferase CheR
MQAVNEGLVEDTEFRLLLEGVRDCYGFDFRDYRPEPLRRRIWERVEAEHVQTVSGYQEKLLHDPESMERLLLALSGASPGMYSEPAFWIGFRKTVVPLLRTYPSVQIWMPACSTGEEVYALAILLEEEGIYPRCRIYATDLSERTLEQAREGKYSLARIAEHAERYAQAGGKALLSDYYRKRGGQKGVMKLSLKENLVFAEHNLATDGPFNEFQVILSGEVLGWFNESLEDRVFALFRQSLTRFGILGLGGQGMPHAAVGEMWYEALAGAPGFYRKVK